MGERTDEILGLSLFFVPLYKSKAMRYTYILITVGLCILSYIYGTRNAKTVYNHQIDTVFITKRDTVTIPKLIKVKQPSDTVFLYDTVEIVRWYEQVAPDYYSVKTYSDTMRFFGDINGFVSVSSDVTQNRIVSNSWSYSLKYGREERNIYLGAYAGKHFGMTGYYQKGRFMYGVGFGTDGVKASVLYGIK